MPSLSRQKTVWTKTFSTSSYNPIWNMAGSHESSPSSCELFLLFAVNLNKGKRQKVHTNRGFQMWFAYFRASQPCFRLDCRKRYWDKSTGWWGSNVLKVGPPKPQNLTIENMNLNFSRQKSTIVGADVHERLREVEGILGGNLRECKGMPHVLPSNSKASL